MLKKTIDRHLGNLSCTITFSNCIKYNLSLFPVFLSLALRPKFPKTKIPDSPLSTYVGIVLFLMKIMMAFILLRTICGVDRKKQTRNMNKLAMIFLNSSRCRLNIFRLENYLECNTKIEDFQPREKKDDSSTAGAGNFRQILSRLVFNIFSIYLDF